MKEEKKLYLVCLDGSSCLERKVYLSLKCASSSVFRGAPFGKKKRVFLFDENYSDLGIKKVIIGTVAGGVSEIQIPRDEVRDQRRLEDIILS